MNEAERVFALAGALTAASKDLDIVRALKISAEIIQIIDSIAVFEADREATGHHKRLSNH